MRFYSQERKYTGETYLVRAFSLSIFCSIVASDERKCINIDQYLHLMCHLANCQWRLLRNTAASDSNQVEQSHELQ